MNTRLVAQVFGVILLIVGVLGFLPPLTPEGKLLGLFQVDTIHNLVHLLTGAAALYLTSTMGEKGAVLFGKVFGIVYALVTVLGFITGSAMGIPGVVEVNSADHLLHVVLTATFLYIGFGTMAKRT